MRYGASGIHESHALHVLFDLRRCCFTHFCVGPFLRQAGGNDGYDGKDAQGDVSMEASAYCVLDVFGGYVYLQSAVRFFRIRGLMKMCSC